MYNFTSDEKKSYLLMLIKLENADGQIQWNEERFIHEIAGKIGLCEGDIEEVRNHPDNFKFTLPSSLNERIIQFYHLLVMMGIDGKITEPEKELCRKLGFRLCLNPPLMDDLINIMVSHLNDKIPEDRLLKAVLKYMN